MEMIRNCKITHLVKDDMRICSARVIFATLVDEHGEEHRVEWLSGPAVERPYGDWDYQETAEFVEAWKKAEVGLVVNLHHAEGTDRKYFLIAES